MKYVLQTRELIQGGAIQNLQFTLKKTGTIRTKMFMFNEWTEFPKETRYTVHLANEAKTPVKTIIIVRQARINYVIEMTIPRHIINWITNNAKIIVGQISAQVTSIFRNKCQAFGFLSTERYIILICILVALAKQLSQCSCIWSN